MAEEHQNHRRFPRISSQHAVLVTRMDAEAEEELTKTRVMGLGGCMFVRGEPLGVGATVELLIAVRGEAVRACSRVAWERPREGGSWEIGVEFLEISDEHRDLVAELLSEPSED